MTTHTLEAPAASGPTRRLARFIAEARYDDLPPLAVERAKVAIMDYFGCTAAAEPTDTGRKIVAFVRDLGSRGVSSVVGTDLRIGAPDSALANGTLGHALDYDDVSWRMIGHPGVTILPAIVALAETLPKVSGRDVILAYVLGFEVTAKLGSVLNLGHYDKGWHATGTFGTMGATAGAAKILGLDEHQTLMALGTAASMAAGSRQNFGTDTKPFHAGRAAQNGVTAAMLASRGFTSDPGMLEARWGFCNLYGGATPYDPEDIVATVGPPWEIVTHGYLTKNYPSCVSTHTGIDAMLDLVAKYDLKPAEVAKIDIGVVHLTPKILIHNDPQTGLEGKFSMQYCLSRALVDRSVRMPHFADSSVHEPAVREMMALVNMFVDPAVNDAWKSDKPRPVILTVTRKDGSTIRTRIDWPSGTPENPLTVERLTEKYDDCAGVLLPPEKVAQTAKMLRALDTVEDIRDLTTLFTTA